MDLIDLKERLKRDGPIPVKALVTHDILLGKRVQGFVPQSQSGTLFSVDTALKRVYVSWEHAKRTDGSGIRAYYSDDIKKYFSVNKQPAKAYLAQQI